MKHTKKVVIAMSMSLFASVAGAQEIHNWSSASGDVWKNASGQCWRDSSWTPATAAPGCDGALTTITPPVTHIVTPVVTPMLPKIEPVQPVMLKEVPVAKAMYSADALFGFDHFVLTPEGKTKLDKLLNDNIHKMNVDVIVAVGHTDSIGSDVYNMQLSMRRAESVKAYLVSHGVPKDKIIIDGKGESTPIATNKNAAGRVLNRRVEIEVSGTVKK